MNDDARFDLHDEAEPRQLQTLVVDDQPRNRRILHAILSELGCVVTCAAGGAEAAELAHTRRFDLIIVDFHMPGLDGGATARAIREGGGPSRGAFIALWTTDDGARVSAGLWDGTAPKPITCRDAAELVAEARRRVELRELDRGEPSHTASPALRG